MSTDRAAFLLSRLDEIVASVAAVVLVAALALIALALIARLQEEPAVLYDLVVPQGQPPTGELLFVHLHAVLRSRREDLVAAQPRLVVIAHGSAGRLRLRFRLADRHQAFVGAALDALWPGAHLVRVPVAARPRTAASLEWLPRAVAQPLRATSLPGAPAALARVLARAAAGEELSLEIALQPEARERRALISGLLTWALFRVDTRSARRGTGATERAAKSPHLEVPFACSVTIAARAQSRARAWSLVRELEPSLRALCAGTSVRCGFIRRGAGVRGAGVRGAFARFRQFGGGVLTPAELAILFPIAPLAAAEVSTAFSPVARPGGRLLGLRTHAANAVEVRLSLAESRHHLHALGPTGTGKSTLLLNLAAQDIAAGRGCAVLDPKGDLVRDLLARIPRERVGDVVYLGPDEGLRAVGINPLALTANEDPDLAAENVLSIFKRIYRENWGPRTDDVLKSCLLTLLAAPEPTLAHIPALLTDPRARRPFTARVRDDIGLGGFWSWYDGVSEGKRLEVSAPLLNKVRDFLLRPRLRRMLCQPRSTVDVHALIDDGGILLADLGTGRWGESASALAGSFLVARIWQAALARQAISEERRPDFQLYIDEFQTFLGIPAPFADALAQARGLRLSLTLANQHLAQLPHELKEAVRANAASRVVFRCAPSDAIALEREFAPLDAAMLIALPRFHAAVRLVSGAGSFSVRTLPPSDPPLDAPSAGEVLRASGERFGRSVSEVDAALRGALERREDAGEEPSSEPTEV
jgi:hypothetical protein